MLVFTRKAMESIIINGNIEITIISARGDKARIGITAPKDITVHRKEVYNKIQKGN